MSDKKYSKDGRYSTKSVIAAKNRRDESRYGELNDRSDDWSQEDMDTLLEAFLAEGLPHLGDDSLVTRTRRTLDGVRTQLRKFGIALGSKEKGYIPVNRTSRDWTPITNRDVYLIQLAVAERGRQERAHSHSYLGRVLMRTVENVAKLFEVLANEHGGFGIKEKPIRGETEQDRVARLIQQTLLHFHFDWGKGVFDFDGLGILKSNKLTRG